MWHAPRVTPCLQWHVLFRVLCCQALTSKLLVAPLYVTVRLLSLRASSCFKYYTGTLSWNGDTLEGIPNPLFHRLVRCFAHEHSFTNSRAWIEDLDYIPLHWMSTILDIMWDSHCKLMMFCWNPAFSLSQQKHHFISVASQLAAA